jgi:hypothetical protein
VAIAQAINKKSQMEDLQDKNERLRFENESLWLRLECLGLTGVVN